MNSDGCARNSDEQDINNDSCDINSDGCDINSDSYDINSDGCDINSDGCDINSDGCDINSDGCDSNIYIIITKNNVFLLSDTVMVSASQITQRRIVLTTVQQMRKTQEASLNQTP